MKHGLQGVKNKEQEEAVSGTLLTPSNRSGRSARCRSVGARGRRRR